MSQEQGRTFSSTKRQKRSWYLKPPYSEGRRCRKRIVEGQDWAVGINYYPGVGRKRRKQNRRQKEPLAGWEESRKSAARKPSKESTSERSAGLACAPAREPAQMRTQKRLVGLVAPGQRCPWWAILTEWWRQKSHGGGCGVRGKRQALTSMDNLLEEFGCKMMKKKNQTNREIAVRGSWVKRRHFSKIAEIPAYLFADGNDSVKSKKVK